MAHEDAEEEAVVTICFRGCLSLNLNPRPRLGLRVKPYAQGRKPESMCVRVGFTVSFP